MRDHSGFLSVAPLPATVFLMQRDVINHYRYALTYYFDLTLTEPFLQKSSIGTPYEKWAYFTNEDFDTFAFTTQNLVRYTSRLIHETTCKALKDARHFSDMKSLSNRYTGPICEFRHQGRAVGVRVNGDQTLDVTQFATGPSHEGTVHMKSSAGGPTSIFHVTTDSSGNETKKEITDKENRESSRIFRETSYDIQDRSILHTLKNSGLSEVETLVNRNSQFGEYCRRYRSSMGTFSPFNSLHESWCI